MFTHTWGANYLKCFHSKAVFDKQKTAVFVFYTHISISNINVLWICAIHPNT